MQLRASVSVVSPRSRQGGTKFAESGVEPGRQRTLSYFLCILMVRENRFKSSQKIHMEILNGSHPRRAEHALSVDNMTPGKRTFSVIAPFYASSSLDTNLTRGLNLGNRTVLRFAALRRAFSLHPLYPERESYMGIPPQRTPFTPHAGYRPLHRAGFSARGSWST